LPRNRPLLMITVGVTLFASEPSESNYASQQLLHRITAQGIRSHMEYLGRVARLFPFRFSHETRRQKVPRSRAVFVQSHDILYKVSRDILYTPTRNRKWEARQIVNFGNEFLQRIARAAKEESSASNGS